MKAISSHPLFLFGVGILFVIFIHLLVSQFNNIDTLLNQAYKSYEKGELATTIAERTDGFNESLSIYKRLEKEYSPDSGNGKLYYNIASNYYQLNQYPDALLYYLRSEILRPRDEKVKMNLEKTLDKLDIKPEISESIFEKIFFFHKYLSPPEKLQALFVFSFLLFILGSCYIWYNFFGLKALIAITVFFFLAIFGSIFYSQYLAPSYGVILKANFLYQDAGIQYAKVEDQPILPGTKVTLLETIQNGKWLKIVTPNGTVGFIQYDSMQII